MRTFPTNEFIEHEIHTRWKRFSDKLRSHWGKELLEVIPVLMNLSGLNTHFRSKLNFYFLSKLYVFNCHRCHTIYLKRKFIRFLWDKRSVLPANSVQQTKGDIDVIIDKNARSNVMAERLRLPSEKDFIKTFGVLLVLFYISNLE